MSRASTDPAVHDAPHDGAAASPSCEAGARTDDAMLSRSTLMTLRRVLHAYRDGWLLEGRLAAAARMIAEDAQLRDRTAEQMLVALERAWAALDDVQRTSPRDAQALLRRLATLGVQAYHAPSRAARHARGRTGAASDPSPCRDARSAA